MKKLISLLLALTMVMSLALVVSAEEVSYAATDAFSFTELTKTYKNENNVIVSEKLTFKVEADKDNPAEVVVTVDDVEVDSASESITVNIPSLSKAGVYRFTITENAGTAAGVTYSTDTIHVIVMVEYDNDAKKLVVAETTSYIEKLNGSKDKEFENSFESGSFTVDKEVTGNMANQNDTFTAQVTLTLPAGETINNSINFGGKTVTADKWTKNDDGCYTYTDVVTISHAADAVTFSDIPVDVTVAVVELDAEGNAVTTAEADVKDGYKYVSTTVDGSNGNTLTVENETSHVVIITNDKTVGVETGVSMDSIPYVILIAVCAVAAVAFVTKRRRVEF